MNRPQTIVLNALMAVVSFAALSPFYIMLTMSTYTTEQLYHGVKLLPGTQWLNNARTVFSTDYGMYYVNSIYIAVLNVLLMLLVSSMAGYALSKFRFRARNAIMVVIIAIMVIPNQVNLVAFVMEMKAFGWVNTHLPLIVPAANPFGVFWMASCMRDGVPDEIVDAAKIDGCNHASIFFRLVLPLSKPALGTLTLLGFLGSWNNFLMPMTIITNPKLYTIPLGIANFSSRHRVDVAAQIFALSFAVIPILIVFAVFSKSMIRGLTAGAIKG